ncbi:MAG: DoxX family membrane protein [Crocinitomix sp.]|nr:DoxX family membrane protein [Crocinitomix sp.]
MNEMKLRTTKLDIIGRSLILNIAAIVLNIFAVVLIAKGFHESTESGAFIMKLSGFVLIAITLFVMAILKGMLLFSYVSRVLVGGLFIVSGLVKANDPWGFAFKLEEYFEPTGLTADFSFFGWFEGYELQLSILICVAEIVLGVAVILGGKIKLASWSLVIMMIFFSWLTYYTYSCNASQLLALQDGSEFGRQCVTDCGCFGDALRGSVGRSLTPLESFWKDLVLFYLCIIIFINQWKIKLNTVKENWIMVPASLLVVIFFSWVFGWMFPIFFALIAMLGAFIMANLNIGKIGKAWKMAMFVAFISILFSLYTASYLPIKDYRPYAIGNDINKQMTNGIDEVAEFVLLYDNKETGKVDTFALDQWEVYGDTNIYAYKDRTKKTIIEGSPHSIQDFSAVIDYEQLSETDKANAYIDSVIKADYQNYYEDKLLIASEYGVDTIPVIDYDTLYYPDSSYTKKGTYTGLIDPSTKFSMDLTKYLISADNMFLMTIRDIESVNEGSIPSFKSILEGAKENNIPFFVLCPSSGEVVEAFKQKYDFDATFLAFDGIEVKIIVRSNPGLILLKKGVVMDKWPSRSVEDFEDIYADYINTKQD